MNIFDKRPLALILCMMISGFVAFSIGEVWLRSCVIVAAPLLLLIGIMKREWRKMLITLSIVLAISILCSVLYFDILYFADSRFDGEVTVTAQVISKNESTRPNITIKCDSVNEQPFTSYQLLVYPSSDQLSMIEVGDKIKFQGTIEAFDSSDKDYYISLGYNGIISEINSVKIIATDQFSPEVCFEEIREALSRRACLLSDEDSGNLSSALLLGEKHRLDSNVVHNFSRIGISHILALSGMHLAILSIGLRKLLAYLGVRKKASSIITIPFVIAYMALTGFPVSVVRAGIMVIILSLLYILVGNHDSLTSLSVAVFIIIVLSPNSIYDLSLWLSALATLGVVAYGEYRVATKSNSSEFDIPVYRKFLNILLFGLLPSVFAILATLIICVLSFPAISIISSISTFIISPIIELVMYLGTFTLILGNILPIGYLLTPVCHFALWVVDMLSSIDGIYASTGYLHIQVFAVIISIILVIFLLIKIKHKKIAVASISVLFILFLVTVFITSEINMNNDGIVYSADDNSSDVIIVSDGSSCVISSASYSIFSASQTANNLYEENIVELDYLALVNYSFLLPECYDQLSSKIRVKNIILPVARCEEEQIILDTLTPLCLDYGTNIIFFESNTAYLIGNYEITLHHSSEYNGDFSRSVYSIKHNDEITTYLSCGMMLDDISSYSYRIMKDSTSVIFGPYGKEYEKARYIELNAPKATCIIMGSNNLYLNQDVARLYKKNGCEIISHPNKVILSGNR